MLRGLTGREIVNILTKKWNRRPATLRHYMQHARKLAIRQMKRDGRWET